MHRTSWRFCCIYPCPILSIAPCLQFRKPPERAGRPQPIRTVDRSISDSVAVQNESFSSLNSDFPTFTGVDDTPVRVNVYLLFSVCYLFVEKMCLFDFLFSLTLLSQARQSMSILLFHLGQSSDTA